ncbi:uncharacterized protein E0L32_009311 [Thyridium curvatum]|uniref:Uncharacterized protein n=1 Tax=Thyridium curvatum TaxID=1093900 RepID=A0A507ANU9_9PEZI|nr:uncharacterized protein E0L32_009311 [Thyridium curvatum]TPX09423.1 hypothetical protein E0L32_009311 [Thyridium curvatum]
MAPRPELPTDIWWMVILELTARRDFNTLLATSTVSKTLAGFALPQLYSIHELASASTDDASIVGKRKWAQLWRSIILSSIGQTALPYCLWVKNLKLGNLRDLLNDIAPYQALRDDFFSGHMEPFNISQTSGPPTRKNKPRLDLQAISNKVGDTITAFVKDAADRENKAVSVAHLEGHYIPMDLLPTWISRLPTLVSLTIQDGSVLGPNVAEAIRNNCPSFKELECYYCDGATVDEDLASFFRALPPNTLEAFNVISLNRLGQQAFEALGCHGESLRKLGLSSLQTVAFEHFGALAQCEKLEALTLEAANPTGFNWEATHADSFQAAITWLKSCKSLTTLQVAKVPNASTVLATVLRAPAVRLRALDVRLIDAEPTFYSALGFQTEMEDFAMRTIDEELEPGTPQHMDLISSLCKCQKLRELDLITTLINVEDVTRFSQSLVHLEELGFDGSNFFDLCWKILARFKKLKTLNILASSLFTADGIRNFLADLEQHPDGSHDGLALSIMNQAPHVVITPTEETSLQKEIAAKFGGRIDLVYERNPQEDDDTDFADD